MPVIAIDYSVPRPIPRPLHGARASSKEQFGDGIQQGIYLVKSFPIIIEALLFRNWPIVEAALGEHDFNCLLDLHNSRMTFSTTRTDIPADIERKARQLLELLSRNVPVSSALRIIKVPDCECEIINTGLNEVDNFYLKELQGKISCRIFVCDGFVGDGFVSDGFVVAIGPLEGLAIVRKAVEYFISSSYSKAGIVTKKLDDLHL